MAMRKKSERTLANLNCVLHEAGHRVAGYILDIDVPRIALAKQDRFDPDMHWFPERLDPNHEVDREELERTVMVTAAGMSPSGGCDYGDLDFHTRLLCMLVPQEEEVTHSRRNWAPKFTNSSMEVLQSTCRRNWRSNCPGRGE